MPQENSATRTLLTTSAWASLAPIPQNKVIFSFPFNKSANAFNSSSEGRKEECVGNVLTAENISSAPRAVTSPGTPITATPEPGNCRLHGSLQHTRHLAGRGCHLVITMKQNVGMH